MNFFFWLSIIFKHRLVRVAKTETMPPIPTMLIKHNAHALSFISTAGIGGIVSVLATLTSRCLKMMLNPQKNSYSRCLIFKREPNFKQYITICIH